MKPKKTETLAPVGFDQTMVKVYANTATVENVDTNILILVGSLWLNAFFLGHYPAPPERYKNSANQETINRMLTVTQRIRSTLHARGVTVPTLTC